ncbi:high mobility group box, partial [Trametopsis cervina]
IPRPPNAFLFYRSWYWSQEKTKTTVERDHRKISRIAGHLWRTSLTEDEKQPFKELAAEEKERHSKLYPGYKYSPVYRNKTSKKK